MLKTVEAVIEELGGATEVASLAAVRLPAVSNWKSRGGIPAEFFVLFTDALKARGKRADPALFGMVGVSP